MSIPHQIIFLDLYQIPKDIPDKGWIKVIETKQERLK